MSETAPSRKLILWRAWIGSKCVLDIDEKTAAALKGAMDDINEMVDVEQKFDILLENFIELETEMANRVTRYAYRNIQSAQEFFDDKQAFNRRIMNVLTSAKLYIDQIEHHIGVFYPKDAAKRAEIKAKLSHEYDNVLGYRVMEALRNYAQHRGLPLQGLSYDGRWVNQQTEDRELVFTVALNLITDQLGGKGGLKASVLKELRALGSAVDVKSYMRDYVEGIARVHDHFRYMVKARIENAEALLQKWKDAFSQACGDEHGTLGLCVAEQLDDGRRLKLVSLHDEPLDYLKALAKRSSALKRLAARVVTSRPKATDE